MSADRRARGRHAPAAPPRHGIRTAIAGAVLAGVAAQLVTPTWIALGIVVILVST
jgi:hypothetical protein